MGERWGNPQCVRAAECLRQKCPLSVRHARRSGPPVEWDVRRRRKRALRLGDTKQPVVQKHAQGWFPGVGGRLLGAGRSELQGRMKHRVFTRMQVNDGVTQQPRRLWRVCLRAHKSYLKGTSLGEGGVGHAKPAEGCPAWNPDHRCMGLRVLSWSLCVCLRVALRKRSLLI